MARTVINETPWAFAERSAYKATHQSTPPQYRVSSRRLLRRAAGSKAPPWSAQSTARCGVLRGDSLSVLLSSGRVLVRSSRRPFVLVRVRFSLACRCACSVLMREVGGDDEKLWFARLNGGGFNPACLAELKSSPSPSSPSSGPRSDPLLRFPRVF